MEFRYLNRYLSSDSLHRLMFEVRLTLPVPAPLHCRLCLVDRFGNLILTSDYREIGRVDDKRYLLANVMLAVEPGLYALGFEFGVPNSNAAAVRYLPFQHWGNPTENVPRLKKVLTQRNLVWHVQQDAFAQPGNLENWIPLMPMEALEGYWFSNQHLIEQLLEGGLDKERASALANQVIAPWKPTVELNFNDPSIHTQTGKKTVEGILCNGEPGFLMFGPYVPLMKGEYRLALTLDTSEPEAEVLADVVCERGQKQLLPPTAVILKKGCHEYAFDFQASISTLDVEFRIRILRPGAFLLRAVRVEPLDIDQALRMESLMEFGLMIGHVGGMHAAEVSSLFLNGLGRSPNSEEAEIWSGKLSSELISWILNRDEHRDFVCKCGFTQEVQDTLITLSGKPPEDSQLNDWSSILDLGYSRAKQLLLKVALARRSLQHSSPLANAAKKREIVFVYDQKKDHDSLRPIYDELTTHPPDCEIQILTLNGFLDSLVDKGWSNPLIAVAHEYIDRVLRLTGIQATYQAVEKFPADARVGRYDLKPNQNNPDEDDERQPRLPGGDVQLHQP